MKRGCIKHVECLDTASLPFRMDKCGEGEDGRCGEGQNTGTVRSLPLRGGIARFLSVMMFPGHGVELKCRTGDACCRHRHSSLILPPVGLHPAALLAGEQSVRSVFQVSPCASEENQV